MYYPLLDLIWNYATHSPAHASEPMLSWQTGSQVRDMNRNWGNNDAKHYSIISIHISMENLIYTTEMNLVTTTIIPVLAPLFYLGFLFAFRPAFVIIIFFFTLALTISFRLFLHFSLLFCLQFRIHSDVVISLLQIFSSSLKFYLGSSLYHTKIFFSLFSSTFFITYY